MSDTKFNLQTPKTEVITTASFLRGILRDPLWIGTPRFEGAISLLVKDTLNGDKVAAEELDKLVHESPGVIGKFLRKYYNPAQLKEHGVNNLEQSKI
jgi:hypothetical protein